MARTATKPHETVLRYFETADLATADLILDLARSAVKRRAAGAVITATAKVIAAGIGKAPAKAATQKAAPTVKARKKPGPKPGSKRRPRQTIQDVPPQAPPIEDEPLLDFEEEFAHQ